jgi:hypothetical protein
LEKNRVSKLTKLVKLVIGESKMKSKNVLKLTSRLAKVSVAAHGIISQRDSSSSCMLAVRPLTV